MRTNRQLDNLRKRLLRESCEGVLVSSEINQRYLSGFNYTDGYVLILPEKAYLLADFRYIEAARNTACPEDFEVIMPEGSMLSEIALLAEINGLKKIYVEDATLSCAMLEKLRATVEGVEFVGGASAAILEERTVKADWELEKIAEAQSITDRAFAHILGFIRHDMSEIEVALELEFFMRRNGAEMTAFETIAVSGKASSMPHGVPRNVKLEQGFLTMDFGARVDGYCSDMTRTIVIGKADDEMKRLYNTVLDAQRAALDIICEGVECRRVDKVARDLIDNAGYRGCFGHSLGHGVGMYIHESPGFSAGAPAGKLLGRGHVVTVEPGIYIAGKYGCRIEDMIAIDNGGNMINFTKSPKELIEI